MEGGVEDGDVGKVGERLLARIDPLQVGRVVQRGERGKVVDDVLHRLVDEHRPPESVSSLDDPVADGDEVHLI